MDTSSPKVEIIKVSSRSGREISSRSGREMASDSSHIASPWDVDYTQQMTVDPDRYLRLDAVLSNEPLQKGDIIEYYHSIFVWGDKRGLYRAEVLGVSPNNPWSVLQLSTGYVMDEEDRVRRVKVMRGGKLEDHPGIWRQINEYTLVASVNDGLSGVERESRRFSAIYQEKLSEKNEEMKAHGLDPLPNDLLRTVHGEKNRGGSRGNDEPPSKRQKDEQPLTKQAKTSSGETDTKKYLVKLIFGVRSYGFKIARLTKAEIEEHEANGKICVVLNATDAMTYATEEILVNIVDYVFSHAKISKEEKSMTERQLKKEVKRILGVTYLPKDMRVTIKERFLDCLDFGIAKLLGIHDIFDRPHRPCLSCAKLFRARHYSSRWCSRDCRKAFSLPVQSSVSSLPTTDTLVQSFPGICQQCSVFFPRIYSEGERAPKICKNCVFDNGLRERGEWV